MHSEAGESAEPAAVGSDYILWLHFGEITRDMKKDYFYHFLLVCNRYYSVKSSEFQYYFSKF